MIRDVYENLEKRGHYLTMADKTILIGLTKKYFPICSQNKKSVAEGWVWVRAARAAQREYMERFTDSNK